MTDICSANYFRLLYKILIKRPFYRDDYYQTKYSQLHFKLNELIQTVPAIFQSDKFISKSIFVLKIFLHSEIIFQYFYERFAC